MSERRHVAKEGLTLVPLKNSQVTLVLFFFMCIYGVCMCMCAHVHVCGCLHEHTFIHVCMLHSAVDVKNYRPHSPIFIEASSLSQTHSSLVLSSFPTQFTVGFLYLCISKLASQAGPCPLGIYGDSRNLNSGLIPTEKTL